MIRIAFYLVVIFALGLGFAWLADRPGTITIESEFINGPAPKLPIIDVAVALVVIVATVMASWWILKGLWNSPRNITRYFRARKRDRGYQSLSTGMIAAGAGDMVLARKMTKQANGLLSSDQEPLIKLLDAQTLMLEGEREKAQQAYEAMVEDPETRAAGLRGLYLEAIRLDNREARQYYAEKAFEVAPQLDWASEANLELSAAQGDWAKALELVQLRKNNRQIDKAGAKRLRAVLLTGKAMSISDADPAGAKSAALEASKLAPGLVPAALTAAQALFRLGDFRKGSKILETQWKSNPHPQIAAAYLRARPGDSAVDRLKRAERLSGMKQNHPESLMIMAQSYLDTGDFEKARKSIEAVLRQAPRESAWLLLADIEETETGDQGRIRQWLAKAVKAPRDPLWTADGYTSEHWAPMSPVTGKLDAFEWRVPVARVGPMIDNQMQAATDEAVDEESLAAITALPVVEAVVEEPEVVEAVVEEPNAEEVVAEEKALVEAEPEIAAESQGEPEVKEPRDTAETEPQSTKQPAEAVTVPPSPDIAAPKEEDVKRTSLIPPPPDDPGVRQEEPKKSKMFGLF